QEGLKNITPQALNEYIGISFTDVLKEIHFANSKEYVFTSLEQNQIKLTEEQTSKGIFYIEDGLWSFRYGEGANDRIKGVLQVEALT
ncbi:MAG: hypothetical protein PHE41_08070, partial [Eubacteriales bacterium]|nr:hypothetical protein [Eubacteriales bacterium]